MLLDIYIPGTYVTGDPHTKSEHFTYGFVLGPLQFHSIGQNSHLTSKQQVGCVGFH